MCRGTKAGVAPTFLYLNHSLHPYNGWFSISGFPPLIYSNINKNTVSGQSETVLLIFRYWQHNLCGFTHFTFFEWVIARICARPTTTGVSKTIASESPRTAVGDDARCLIRQIGGWIHNFSFQSDFFPSMFTIGYLYHFPITISQF
jgi:hypothetical protein